jgi:hypothetical protein
MVKEKIRERVRVEGVCGDDLHGTDRETGKKYICEVNTLSDGKITKALENYDFSLRLQYRG